MASKRGKAGPSNANLAATPAVSAAAFKGAQELDVKPKELVPGKLTEKEWDDLIAIDEGVETVYELIEEVVERAAAMVLEHHIAAEIYPYSVQSVKASILKIIALEFVARDEGEKNTDTDPTWLPDEPPVPPPIDSWACGMIPLASSESLSSLLDAMEPIQVHEPVCAEEEKISTRSTTSNITTLPSSLTSTLKSTAKSAGKSTGGKSSTSSKRKRVSMKMPELPPTGVPRRSHHEAKLVLLDRPPEGVSEIRDKEARPQAQSSARAKSLPAPLNEASVTPFDLGTQPAWIKDVKYDSKGNIVDMVKLDPAKFPSYGTKPAKVSIIYPPKDAVRQGFAKQRAKFKSLDTYTSILKKSKGKAKGSLMTSGGSSEQYIGEGEERPQYAGRTVAIMPSDAGLSKKASSRRFPSLPALPALVDTIDPLPGVTVREKGRVVHGPSPIYRLPISPGVSLRPVKPLGERGVAARKDIESRVSPQPYRASAPCTT